MANILANVFPIINRFIRYSSTRCNFRTTCRDLYMARDSESSIYIHRPEGFGLVRNGIIDTLIVFGAYKDSDGLLATCKDIILKSQNNRHITIIYLKDVIKLRAIINFDVLEKISDCKISIESHEYSTNFANDDGKYNNITAMALRYITCRSGSLPDKYVQNAINSKTWPMFIEYISSCDYMEYNYLPKCTTITNRYMFDIYIDRDKVVKDDVLRELIAYVVKVKNADCATKLMQKCPNVVLPRDIEVKYDEIIDVHGITTEEQLKIFPAHYIKQLTIDGRKRGKYPIILAYFLTTMKRKCVFAALDCWKTSQHSTIFDTICTPLFAKVNQKLLHNIEIVRVLITINGRIYEKCPINIQSNVDIILLAVHNCNEMMRFVPKKSPILRTLITIYGTEHLNYDNNDNDDRDVDEE